MIMCRSDRKTVGPARRLVMALLIAVSGTMLLGGTATAATATSPNYGVSEVRFGSGGELHACSATYCAKQSAGETTVGNTKSTNYQAQAGANTDRQPFLEVINGGAAIDLGTLDPSVVRTATSTFSIKTYLASGYQVYINGQTPTNATSGHALTTMASAGLSTPGSEQFGINLRQNTSPVIGADTVQVPSSTFSFGAAATGYDIVNYFKYVSGDAIANSKSSSGQTVYTMSMIANIAPTTGGGSYRGRLVINVVPTF